MKIEKLNDNTNITSNSKQLEILKKNFPECFDKNGNFLPEKLNNIIKSSGTDISKESYGITWLGKSYARLLANETPLTLITEDREHNNKDENKNSQNMLIKGDNLEVLKHLKNAYSESIKMIYIDPPYNTGGDGFVYQDDRKFTKEQLSDLAGISIDEASRILEFTQSKSNSHSAWLTFMYPRLYIARELLKEDGVIFISIDDNEVAQLRILCDEIFGEANFVAKFVAQTNPRGRSLDKFVAKTFEYILCYALNVDISSSIFGIPKTDKALNEYKYSDNKGKYRLLELRNRNPEFNRSNRPNLYYPIYINPINNEVSLTKSNLFYECAMPINSKGEDGCWTWSIKKFEAEVNDLVANLASTGIWRVFRKDYIPEGGAFTKEKSIWLDKAINHENGKERLGDIFKLSGNQVPFSFPKSTDLISKCINIAMTRNDVILDFFAGSGTTGDAVMQLNAEDGGKRKYICVQLDETIEETKPAYEFCIENNLKPVISSITQERLIRAANKIQKDTKEEFDAENSKKKPSEEKLAELEQKLENIKNQDFGFKVFETRPLIDGLNDCIENYNQFELLENDLSDDEIQAVLTTYKVHDGALLNADFTEVKLDNYTAYMVEDKIYFMNRDFTTSALKAFIEKIDSDKSFKPTKLVIFGYNFDSKHQREIKEAITSYTNKKSIEIDMIVRY
ncbi:hypothetical protein LO80_08810 [Candidatus Francisella endociliophora]|uniref:site-specific DNA-methyltransferase (adenine-specific) n=1 Tax=Candidatus Francisella endociliophora TaxID=653937 RepID=A0A097ER53_9GAMM|nr:site-specific DNA-methyltransferase [Francisella sp. FSC1006]AIT10058.1 hypothetical protein LO80_08810 [Francisella sp. FSC1006]